MRKKKVWILVAIVLFILLLPFFLLYESCISFTIGRCVAADNGSYLYVDGNSPVRMVNLTSNDKLFSDLKTGDKILVAHDGVEETYPGSTGIYFCHKLQDGSIDDISVEVINGLTELGWLYEEAPLENLEVVEYKHENVRMALELPENWEYSIDEYSEEGGYYGISIWPEGYSEERLSFQCYDGFGVCGTGLEEKEITLAGLNARMGIYDNNDVWDFIVFTEFQNDFIVMNNGADTWWGEYADEAMSILETIQIEE